jgi:hypothetical protein
MSGAKAGGGRRANFVWVNLNLKFSVFLCLCGEPLCTDPTTEAQRKMDP